MKTDTYLAFNRKSKTVCVVPWASCWEHLQGMFRFGIQMPDGAMADGIGRTVRGDEIESLAKRAGMTLLN